MRGPALSSAVIFRIPPRGEFTYSLSLRSRCLLIIFMAKRRHGAGPTRRSQSWTRPKEPRPSSPRRTYSFTVSCPSLFFPHLTLCVNKQSHGFSSLACRDDDDSDDDGVHTRGFHSVKEQYHKRVALLPVAFNHLPPVLQRPIHPGVLQ